MIYTLIYLSRPCIIHILNHILYSFDDEEKKSKIVNFDCIKILSTEMQSGFRRKKTRKYDEFNM